MSEIPTSQSAVVVGIDGSRSAVRAALWAVDEALHRDVPLRLVHVAPQPEFPEFDNEPSTAGMALRHAVREIGSTRKPVKVHADIRHGRVADVLRFRHQESRIHCCGSSPVGALPGRGDP
jgi:nucleotide-binding universal stress UspA family protein